MRLNGKDFEWFRWSVKFLLFCECVCVYGTKVYKKWSAFPCRQRCGAIQEPISATKAGDETSLFKLIRFNCSTIASCSPSSVWSLMTGSVLVVTLTSSPVDPRCCSKSAINWPICCVAFRLCLHWSTNWRKPCGKSLNIFKSFVPFHLWYIWMLSSRRGQMCEPPSCRRTWLNSSKCLYVIGEANGPARRSFTRQKRPKTSSSVDQFSWLLLKSRLSFGSPLR